MLKKQFLAALLLLGTMGFAQTIPASNGQPYVVNSSGQTTTTTATSPCGLCTPAGWLSGGGTPDISNATTAASNATSGGGATWTANESAGNNGAAITLPLPPNGHTTWISLRDIGTANKEESIYTTLSGLTIGREYEVVVYALTATTKSLSNTYYAAKYIDKFTYEVVGTTPVVDVDMTVEPRKVWVTKTLRFKATATSHTLYIRPGNDITGIGGATSKMETIQLSVTLNAINTVPVANNDTATTTQGTPVTINVLTNDNEYDAGQNIVVSSVDLDPSTPGIQTSITTAQGTWTVSGGVVTFTPASGFVGTATLSYTIQDDYTVSGSNPVTSAPATSSPATISVTVAAPPCNGTQTTYKLNVATTLANNTIATNGGTLTLTFSRTSGPAIPGVADTFTIPVTYSGMNNTMGTGAVNHWESLAVGVGGLAGYVVILPNTTKTSGGIYHNLPASNKVSLPISANASNTDKLFNHYLGNGTIKKIGNFSIEFGNFPTVFPAGVNVVEQSLTVRQAGNSGISSSGSTFYSIGYLLKPDLQNDLQPVDGIASTNAFSVQPGQTYTYWYSAFDDNLGVTATNAGNRGAGINGSITLCYDEDHCNAGTDQVPLSGNTLSNY